jgi:hypothetical protein
LSERAHRIPSAFSDFSLLRFWRTKSPPLRSSVASHSISSQIFFVCRLVCSCSVPGLRADFARSSTRCAIDVLWCKRVDSTTLAAALFDFCLYCVWIVAGSHLGCFLELSDQKARGFLVLIAFRRLFLKRVHQVFGKIHVRI